MHVKLDGPIRWFGSLPLRHLHCALPLRLRFAFHRVFGAALPIAWYVSPAMARCRCPTRRACADSNPCGKVLHAALINRALMHQPHCPVDCRS